MSASVPCHRSHLNDTLYHREPYGVNVGVMSLGYYECLYQAPLISQHRTDMSIDPYVIVSMS